MALYRKRRYSRRRRAYGNKRRRIGSRFRRRFRSRSYGSRRFSRALRRFRRARRRLSRRGGRRSRRSGFRRRTGRARRRWGGRHRRYARKFAKARKQNRRLSRRPLRGYTLLDRTDAQLCDVKPGVQHFRDFPGTGSPAIINQLLNLGQVEHARRMRNWWQRGFGDPSTSDPSHYPLITHIDPFKIRQKIKEKMVFTVYNTGSTNAYITIIRSYWRRRLDKNVPTHILAYAPNTYIGGPFVENKASPGNTQLTQTTFIEHAASNHVANPLQITDANYNRCWTVNVALMGSGLSSLSASNSFAARPFHAKQQFNPWVFDPYWVRARYQTGAFGSNVPKYGGIVPYTAATAPAGNSWWLRFVDSYSYDTTTNALATYLASDNFSMVDQPSTSQSYQMLPAYREERRGPMDRVFKRFSRRIKLGPGQTYRFAIRGRSRTVRTVQDGYFPTSVYSLSTSPSLSAFNPDGLATYWWSGANLSSYPTPPYAYGARDKFRSSVVTFAIRGNTTATVAGLNESMAITGASTIQEAGPAQCVIKRRYLGAVKTWQVRPDRMPPRQSIAQPNDADLTKTNYINMYPTSAPSTAPFSAIGVP